MKNGKDSNKEYNKQEYVDNKDYAINTLILSRCTQLGLK